MTIDHDIDLPTVLTERLTNAHPDVLRDLLATFIHALMGAEADAVVRGWLRGTQLGDRQLQRASDTTDLQLPRASCPPQCVGVVPYPLQMHVRRLHYKQPAETLEGNLAISNRCIWRSRSQQPSNSSSYCSPSTSSYRFHPTAFVIVIELCLAIVLAVQEAPSAHAQPVPLTRTDYDLLPWGSNDYRYWFAQVKSPSRITYLSDPVGQRGLVQRVDVQPGDNGVATGPENRGERAEVMQYGGLGGFLDGQTIVMSWSVFIDSYFSSPQGLWNTFVQLHAGGGAAQSPWQLNLVGDQADLKMRIVGAVGDWSDSKQPTGTITEWMSWGSLPKNQWNDLLAEVRFGCTGDGFVKVWLNAELLVDAENRKIGYCGDPGNYWKQGFYRSAHPKTTRLWFGDTFRWANAADALAHYGWSA